MLFTLPLATMLGTASAHGGAAAAAATGGGLFSSLGGWAGIAGLAGAGANLASAFGSSSGSSIPSQEVKLTKEGEKLQEQLNSQMWRDWLRGPSQNLVASIVRPLREQAGQFARQISMAAVRDPERAGGGVGLSSILSLADQQAKLGMEPMKAKQDLVKQHVQNAFNMGRNMMNVEMQVPFLSAQASMYKSGRDVMRQGVQGQALSGVLNQLGMMNYFKKAGY